MSARDGGPAFPVVPSFRYDHECGCEINVAEDGMSLRDYFAGQALAGMFAADADPFAGRDSDAHVTRRAYEIADAMLAAREGGDS